MKGKKLSDLTLTDVAKMCLWLFLGVIIGYGILYLVAWLLA